MEVSWRYCTTVVTASLSIPFQVWWGCATATVTVDRLCRSGPRGGARGRQILGVHPLSWLLSNNRLEKVPFVSMPHTSSNQLLLSIQDKGCTPSVAHSLALPLGPALHNLWNNRSYRACKSCNLSTIFKGVAPIFSSHSGIVRPTQLVRTHGQDKSGYVGLYIIFVIFQQNESMYSQSLYCQYALRVLLSK